MASLRHSTVAPALIDLLLSRGVPPDRIQKSTGLSAAAGKTPHIRLELGQLIDLWRLAVRETGDEGLALNFLEMLSPRVLYYVNHIVLAARNIGQAVGLWARLCRTVTPSDRITIVREPGVEVLVYENLATGFENRWVPEHILSLGGTIARQVALTEPRYIETHWKHADPGYAACYREVFGVPALFNQPRNAIVMRAGTCDIPVRSDDAYANAFRQLGTAGSADDTPAADPPADSLTGQVRALLESNLRYGPIDVSHVAHQLQLSVRTLHRRLRDEGTSFRIILQDTRRRLAQSYLDRNYSQAEIAELLGYSEPSAFHRAFRAWFGHPPGKSRNRST
jgi:AraC-like DNA-binding protein